MTTQPRQDVQTVTSEGKPIAPLIHGVVLRRAVTQTDERGTLGEILNPAWGVHPALFTYVYQFTIRPGKIKGWHLHHEHDDRIFLSQGTVNVVLYDTRQDSPTHGMVNEIYRSEQHRERAYNHASPDVYRLPLDNDVIPYRFDPRLGWRCRTGDGVGEEFAHGATGGVRGGGADLDQVRTVPPRHCGEGDKINHCRRVLM